MSDHPRSSFPRAPANDEDSEAVSLAEHRELKRQLRDAQHRVDQAEQINAARDRQLAALAHELRAPLASMLLHAQLLRDGDGGGPRDSTRISELLERAVQQQTRLIDLFLSGTRDVAHEQRSQAEPERRVARADPGDGGARPMRRSLDRPGRIKPYEALEGVRILFIDDDFATREAVFEVLALTGAEVALAASTAEGMVALEAFKPQVIVCDIVMPDEDGYAFMRRLRASEAGKPSAIPVLAFTGRASGADKRDALAAGFQLYLSKPIDIDQLRDSVAQLVELIDKPVDGPSPG